MQPELKQAFLEIVNLDADAQAERLARIRASDPDMAAELQRLLQADKVNDNMLEAPIARAVEGMDGLEGDPWIGRRLGAWTITGRLATGGMGTVFRAQRSDEQYRQQAAIKIMGAQLLSPHALARFRAERQILANLKHPNIAALLDGGTTENDLPYLVMEYIDGTPIDEYCDRLRLGIRRRLELFLDVCDAVSHAHRQLVVHRDLKPSNILVEFGRPKLLDFGIAKLLDADADDPAMLTREGEGAMTPAYASPEQLRGEMVTVASDVYSLGVLLYRLLSGRMPHADGAAATAAATGATVPNRPSVALMRLPDAGAADSEAIAAARKVSAARLRKLLAGDLDNITLTALHGDAGQRYDSVAAMADDIRRHLQYRPVAAQPYSLSYRAAKYLRRNFAAVAVGVVIATMITVFTGSTIVQNKRIAAERDAAQRERSTAERVTEFLVDLFEVVDPDEARGRAVTAREVVDAAADRLANTLHEEPVVRAELRHTLGRVYVNLGQYDDAGELLQAALIERERVHGPDAPEVADTLFQLGYLHEYAGDLDAAQAAHERALAIRQRGADQARHADSLFALGGVHLVKRNNDEARRLLESSLMLRRAMYGEEHADVGRTLNDLAILDWRNKDFASATERWRRALEINEAALGSDHPTLRYNLGNVAFALSTRGYAREALPYSRRAAELAEATLGPDHPQLAMPLVNLAFALGYVGDLAGAEPMLARALELTGENDVTSRLVIQTRIAETLMYQGELGAARDTLARVAAAIERLSGERQTDRGMMAAVVMARVELAAGDAAAASRHAQTALDAAADIPSWGTGDIRRAAHTVLARTALPENAQAAVDHAQQALQAGTEELSKSSLGEALDLVQLAALLRDLSRPEAGEALSQLRDVLERGPFPDHPLILAALAENAIEL